jgi:hypothetical protein
MFRLVKDEPERAWAMLLEVIRGLGGVEIEALVFIGADALETLVRSRGEQFIDRIEAEARADVRVAIAVSGVWAWEETVRPRLDQLLAELGQPQRG